MANTLSNVQAPNTHIVTDKDGKFAAEVVSAQPSVGQTGLVVYPIPDSTVTQTQDSADGTTGQNVPSVAIFSGAKDPTGKLQGLTVDSNTALKTSNIGVGSINSTGQVSVASTATQVIAANTSRAAVIITNISSTVTVYLGTSGVTSATGYPLLPNNSISLPVTSTVYGIVATGSQTVGVLEIQ